MPVLSLWQQWRNQVDFTINQLIQWKRAGYQDTWEDKTPFFEEFDFLKATEAELVERYPHLRTMEQRSSLVRYLMNLNRALVCEQLLTLAKSETHYSTMLEVGIKNGEMLDGLWAVCHERLSQDVSLTGIECDMWRISDGLHSRWDKAQYYSQHLPNTSIIAGDAGQHHGRYDLIWFFLPFVFPETADAWGFPRSLYHPAELFEHLITQCLNDGGLLLVTHQVDEEAQALRALLSTPALSSSLQHLGTMELSQPFTTHHPQHVHIGQVWRKKKDA